MSRSGAAWELRFKWAVNAGITHPEFTYDDRMDTRERAVEVAWLIWPRKNQDMSLIGIHVRELPDGEWEHLLPVTTTTCETPPRTAGEANTGTSDTDGEG